MAEYWTEARMREALHEALREAEEGWSGEEEGPAVRLPDDSSLYLSVPERCLAPEGGRVLWLWLDIDRGYDDGRDVVAVLCDGDPRDNSGERGKKLVLTRDEVDRAHALYARLEELWLGD
jgi:hypothetical protein